MSSTSFDFYQNKQTSNTNDRVRHLVSSAKERNRQTSQRDTLSQNLNSPQRPNSPISRPNSPPGLSKPTNKINLDSLLWKELINS